MATEDVFFSSLVPMHDLLILITSVLGNATLLFIAGLKSKRRDSFTRFVIVSAILNLVYSISSYLLDPELHSEDGIMLLISHKRVPFLVEMGDFLMMIYWSLCPAIMTITTVQFIHRFLVICRQSAESKIIWIFGICSTFFFAMFTASFVRMRRSSTLENHVAEHMEEEHHIDIHEAPIIGLILKEESHWHWKNVVYLTVFDLWYGIMISIIVASSVAIYCKWKNSATPQSYQNRNRQIVSALLVQAVSPLLFNVIPTLLTITLPIFGFHLFKYINIVFIVTTWFPLISAVATILLIREYRMLLVHVVTLNKNSIILIVTSAKS